MPPNSPLPKKEVENNEYVPATKKKFINYGVL